MKLIIIPNTPKGDTQLETIKWCEDQINEVMLQYFVNKYRLMKGLKFNFRIALDGKLDQAVKVDLMELAPETEERFNQAVTEAKSQLIFKPVLKEGDKNVR